MIEWIQKLPMVDKGFEVYIYIHTAYSYMGKKLASPCHCLIGRMSFCSFSKILICRGKSFVETPFSIVKIVSR